MNGRRGERHPNPSRVSEAKKQRKHDCTLVCHSLGRDTLGKGDVVAGRVLVADLAHAVERGAFRLRDFCVFEGGFDGVEIFDFENAYLRWNGLSPQLRRPHGRVITAGSGYPLGVGTPSDDALVVVHQPGESAVPVVADL